MNDAPTGTVTISGTLEGKPVRYSTQLTIKADEAGNSFLPRLWARKHLDVLLAKGGEHLEVERVGGYVKDLAGDGVLAFFGAPVAHEDDPIRALRAVRLDLRRGLPLPRRPAPSPDVGPRRPGGSTGG